MTDNRSECADFYDAIVVGAGVAGLTAATMLGRVRRKVIVISRRGRRNSSAESVNNVPYADGLRPAVIYSKMESDARKYGVRIVWDEVRAVRSGEEGVEAQGERCGKVLGRRLVLATGRVDALPRWLPAGTWGTRVFDCPYCHASERAGGDFACVGKGEDTLKLAALARQFARNMRVIITDASAYESKLSNLLRGYGIEILLDSVRDATATESGPICLATGYGRKLHADTILLGEVPQPYTGLAAQLDLDLTPEGYPETTLYGLTSDPLVYSVGNVEGSPYFMWTGAASCGINAARAICEDLAFVTPLLRMRHGVAARFGG
jgi:thioredoxin reductase (NADPH)